MISNKALVIGVIAIVIAITFLPIFPKSIATQVSYQEPSEVPLLYTQISSFSQTFVGLLDWELQDVIQITNIDTQGGTFSVQANFYDGSTFKCSASDQQYIGPGQKITFYLKSQGLSFSTDWQTRYSVTKSITPTTKIIYHIAYRAEYQTKYVNLFGYFTPN
jgi:hypothetical protein